MPYRSLSRALVHLLLLLVLAMTFALFPVTAHAGSTSDLTVDSIWLEDASQPGQPISQVSSGQSFLIVATIKNIGQETASGYYLDVYYDSDYGRGGPDNILAGEVQTWYVGPLTAQDGTHTTRWVVDPDNLIAELDEGNNLKEYTFTIGQQTTTTASATTTVETTQVLTSTGTTSVTSYTTTTITSYTGTTTSTSTIVVPTTVTVAPSTATFTVETTQVLTATGTSTIISYTTTTLASYTATTTSTGAVVVYTTVTNSGGAAASSSLAYLGFLSLLALTVGRVTPLKSERSPGSCPLTERRCSSN